MTGGELKIEVLPAGAVVPAFGLLDAVSKGTLDGGHGVLVYHYGKQNALALWGSGPAFGMDANMLLAWHKYGGGKELLDQALRLDRRQRRRPSCTARCRRSRSAGSRSRSPRPRTSRASSSAPSACRSTCSPAWARRSTRCPAARSCRRWTAACSTRPSSTTRPPTASSASPTSPRSACCRASTRTPSSSRSCFNKTKYDALPAEDAGDHRQRRGSGVGRHVVEGDRPLLEGLHRDADQGRASSSTRRRDAILQTQLEVWDEVVAKKAAENPLFKKIDRVAEGVRRARGASGTWTPTSTAAWPYNHYFGAEGGAPPKKA